MRNFGIISLVLNLVVTWLAAPLAHGQTQNVTFTTLAEFDATNNGANPYAPPVLGADGNLYGALPFGGTNNVGVLFKVATNASPMFPWLRFTISATGMEPCLTPRWCRAATEIFMVWRIKAARTIKEPFSR